MAAIKMRTNTDGNAKCCNCNQEANQVLGIFDIMVCNTLLTICDQCNDQLFRKTLAATCKINGKIKTPQDMAIITKRKKREDMQHA